MTRNVLFIDNFDSFTFNLVESFERLGCEIAVLRNTVDAREAYERAQASEALIVLSPGPGKPRDAGCCLELIRLARGKTPLLGICLGHQAIVEEAGGLVAGAPEPVHGKSSMLDHDGEGMMDTAVVIRTAVVRDGTAFVRAGAGVVHDSDPHREAEETRRKASALLSVLAGTGDGA